MSLVIVKIDNYLIKTFGFKAASQIKMESHRRKDLLRTIFIRELNKTYKYADAVSEIVDPNSF